MVSRLVFLKSPSGNIEEGRDVRGLLPLDNVGTGDPKVGEPSGGVTASSIGGGSVEFVFFASA